MRIFLKITDIQEERASMDDLYHRFSAGDDSAFDALMDEYHSGLILFINKLVGNYSVSEELAADCFVELLLHRKRFLGNSDFRTYLYSIARHKAIDYIRKDAKKKTVPPEEIFELSDDSNIEEEFISDEDKRVLHRAIEKLSDDYRAAVHLIFFEELSYEQAAKVLGKSKKQIDNLIYRAKGALKKILTEEGL